MQDHPMEPIPDCHAASSSGRPPADSGNPIFLLSKKEQNRIAQSNYRQRQKAVTRINQQELGRLNSVANAANAEAAEAKARMAQAQAEVHHLRTLVVTLKARQEEAERLASSANLAKVKAAEAQAAEAEAVVEHLRAMAAFRYQQEELTKEAQAEALRSRAAAEEAKHEAAKVQKEVEYLRALLEALDVDQKQSLRGDSLKSGTSRHVSITGQDMILRADNQEREIMLAFDALKAQLGSIRKKRDSVPAIEAFEMERLAVDKITAMQECAVRIYSDILVPLQNARSRISASSGSMDATECTQLQGEVAAAVPPLHWRRCVPSPFATASSPPSQAPAGIHVDQPLDESGSDPLITLYTIANDSLLLTDDLYGTFHT